MTFPLASIKSDEQLQEAQKVMDQLLARGALSLAVPERGTISVTQLLSRSLAERKMRRRAAGD
jgi:hypothetical protein